MRLENLPPIPTDAAQRKTEIQWLLDHPIWTHPYPGSVSPLSLLATLGQDDDPASHELDDVVFSDHDCQDGTWHECTEIAPVFVNPLTLCIDEDETKNTLFRVWLEAGPYHDMSLELGFEDTPDCYKWRPSHDLDLDCGGNDLEDAMLHQARLVRYYYGEGKESLCRADGQ